MWDRRGPPRIGHWARRSLPPPMSRWRARWRNPGYETERRMSSSPVFKLSIALLLPLTLAWKLSVRPADPAELAQRDRAAQLRIAEFLTRQHFSVTVADSMPEGQPSIRASAGACRLLIA